MEALLRKIAEGNPVNNGRGAATNLHAAHHDEAVFRLSALETVLVTWGNGNNELAIYDPAPMTQELANRLLGIDPAQQTLVKSETGVSGPSLLSFCFFV